jgi:hypothetical protein
MAVPVANPAGGNADGEPQTLLERSEIATTLPRLGRGQLIAGVEVSINCRFWVSTEAAMNNSWSRQRGSDSRSRLAASVTNSDCTFPQFSRRDDPL